MLLAPALYAFPYLRPRLRLANPFGGIQFRFRVGEGHLVRWAQEELALLGEDEDVMVNAREDGFEDIPLKPTPRDLRRELGHRTYGSVV